MNSTNTATKYIAIGLAIFLIIIIFSAMIGALTGILGGLNLLTGNTETKSYEENLSAFSKMNIKFDAGELYILEGDSFKIEADDVSENFAATVKDGVLTVKDQKNFFNSTAVVKIYIPKDIIFEFIDLDMGAGLVQVNGIKSNDVNINGGAGKLVFENIEFKDFNLNAGVGETIISGKLTGKTDIECGVGKVTVNINGKKDNYGIITKTGLGAFYLDGKNVGNTEINKTSSDSIDISGGVGAVYVNFVE